MLNVCTFVHLIIPMVEVPRCLPCKGMQQMVRTENLDSLHQGERARVGGIGLFAHRVCTYISANPYYYCML